MKKSKAVVLGAAMLLSVGIAGCSADQESSSTGTSVAPTTAASSPASPVATDYTNLLIKPSDIDADWTLKTTKAEQNGITGVYGNGAGTEKISTAVIVRENATAAVAAAKNDVAQKAGAAFTPIDIGVDGGILNAPGGTTVVMFAEGGAFAVIEFNSKTGEYVPAEVAVAIAAKQDAAIKNGVK